MDYLFFYKFISNFLKKRSNEDGLTLPELIVSGFISLLVLIAGFTFLRTNLQINKSDEVNLKLGGKINNALDFIVDEINSSKRVLTSYQDVASTCKNRPHGDLVMALKMPDQAKNRASYLTKNQINAQKKKQNWITIAQDCPIFYNLVRDQKYRGKGGPKYILKRTGPTLDESGFYKATDIKTTLIADRIKSSFGDEIVCMNSNNQRWNKRQIKGIVLCVDENGKGAEIMINAESQRNNNLLTVTKSTGGFSRIEDDELLKIGEAGKGRAGNGGQSLPPYHGKPLRSNKMTFFIDVSGSMWQRNAQNKILMEVAKDELINTLRLLPVDSGIKLNIYKFSGYSTPMWRSPKLLTTGTKLYAIQWVSRLRPGGWTNPWNGINNAIQNTDVGQINILSDGIARNEGRCFHNNRYMKYSDCYKQYNDYRATTAYGEVAIDTVSLKNDFCSGNGMSWIDRYRGYSSKWLGQIATRNNGSCTHIR